jgi:hypothetical protein
VLPAKPVLITTNGQPHGVASTAPTREAVAVQLPGNGTRTGGGWSEPASAPDPGPGGIAAGADDDGDVPHDPAELTRTVAALRVELADYKTKIARILDVLARDGAPRGAPHPGGEERH